MLLVIIKIINNLILNEEYNFKKLFIIERVKTIISLFLDETPITPLYNNFFYYKD